AIKQLVQAGVRLFFYLEDRERTLDSPTDKLLLSVATFADELEREKARQRTYDAMLRKAKVGHVTGGGGVGYGQIAKERRGTGRRTPSIARRAAHQRERSGDHPAGVSALRGRMGQDADCQAPERRRRDRAACAAGRPRAWSPSSVHEALYRPLYRGQVIWNQT